jgi:hypothetical protein
LLLFHYSYFQLNKFLFYLKMYRTNVSSSRIVSNKSMHCKVCEDAGKPKSMITSHYPKNRDGFTVCPTLLSQECRNCLKNGHTVKYCTAIQKTNPLKDELNQYKNKKAAKQLMVDVARAFDALYESSDDEEEEEPVKEPVKPVVSWASMVKQNRPKLDWATAETDSEGDEEEE